MLAIAIIFASDILYSWYKRKLTLGRSVFDGIMGLLTILSFLFVDLSLIYRILIVIILIGVGVAIHKLWPRIVKRVVFQSPIIRRKNTPQVESPAIHEPVKYHENRDAIPIKEFLVDAQTVEMVALTFNDLTVHNIDLIRKPLSRGARVTILILDPDLNYVEIHENAYHAAVDVAGQIRNSLKLLCNEKRELEKINQQDRLTIRKFNYLCPHSITIINRHNPEIAWIRVEDRPLGSISGDRPSYTAYQKDDSNFFEIYSNEYDTIFSHSTEEKC